MLRLPSLTRMNPAAVSEWIMDEQPIAEECPTSQHGLVQRIRSHPQWERAATYYSQTLLANGYLVPVWSEKGAFEPCLPSRGFIAFTEAIAYPLQWLYFICFILNPNGATCEQLATRNRHSRPSCQ